jgi:uncharacterized protein YdeI (BOF family)
MRSFYKYCGLLSISAICTNSYAEFISSDTSKQESAISIQEVLKKSDDTYITLEGYILKKIPGEKDTYNFSNIKGEKNEKNIICLEIDEHEDGVRIMPEKAFDETQFIRISGKVEKNFTGSGCKKFKIDVDKVELLNKK